MKNKHRKKLKGQEDELWAKLEADFLVLKEQSSSEDPYKIVTLVRFSNELKAMSDVWLEQSKLH